MIGLHVDTFVDRHCTLRPIHHTLYNSLLASIITWVADDVDPGASTLSVVTSNDPSNHGEHATSRDHQASQNMANSLPTVDQLRRRSI